MHFPIDDRPGALDVGHIEEAGVGSSGKVDAEFLAHLGVRAIAPGDVRDFAGLHRSIRPLQTGLDLSSECLARRQLGLPLNVHTQAAKLLDEHFLVLVLRKDQQVRKRAQPDAELAERHATHPLALHPEVQRVEGLPTPDRGISHPELPVKLQGSCVDDDGSGSCSRAVRLVDDADGHAKLGQEDGQHQPGRSGADDENLCAIRGHGARG